MPPVGFGDADSFYASAEAVRRPWLAGLPVGVLGNQGACVIARNYPMKRYGVAVGQPVWEAKKKCPQGGVRQTGLPVVRDPLPADARRGRGVLPEGRLLQRG